MNETKELSNNFFLNNPKSEELEFEVSNPGKHFLNVLIMGNTRINLSIRIKNSEAEVLANIIYFGQRDQVGNIEIATIHEARKSKSSVKIKSVLPEKTSVNLSGLIRVEKDAIFTEADLKAEALLLGTNARAEFLPSLEILANQVAVSHGATVSSFDEEKMFYLKTRGLSEIEAKTALIESFIEDAVCGDTRESVDEAIKNLTK